MGIKSYKNANTKDFSYAKMMQYDNTLREYFAYCMNRHNVNAFFFLIRDSADLDLVNALQFVRIRRCGNSHIICIFCNCLRDNLSEKDKQRYDNIADICDVKIELRAPIFTQEYEQKVVKSLIDRSPYCIFINGENQNSLLNLAIDYAKSKYKTIYCYDESVAENK